MAAGMGYTEIVNSLIKRGANLEPVTVDGVTPLHLAARDGHTEVVKMIINCPRYRRANINAAENNGWNALHMAACNGHVDTVKTIIEYGANPRARTNDGYTALELVKRFSDASNQK